ncbi:DUF6421 family protein [Bacillus toyonensis]|uniref:DUF6421 family protein n=1 Tax=Bacillus toyonensis TaxID=155322 RepID=UPI0018D1C68F|nr:DUF6421 family protein [Bacillus toyonensis]MBH0358280.1 hypothetical protein [Bacillus toyonensis biovar Thuringiensis]
MLISSDMNNLKNLLWYNSAEELVLEVEKLRVNQNSLGQINKEDSYCEEIIERIILILEKLKIHFDEGLVKAIIKDLIEWKESGINNTPKFDFTFGKYNKIENKEFGMFFFPVKKNKIINFEVCFYYRNEPEAITHLREELPFDTFMGVELILGTKGILEANVFSFFPEAIVTNSSIEQDKFSLFFINKYLQVFHQITKPIGEEVLKTPLSIFKANHNDIYTARMLLSYLHDYYHYKGVLPLNVFFKEKSSLLGSSFEEVRVDISAYLYLLNKDSYIDKLAKEIFLVERLLRYSYADDPEKSFDCLTNYILFEYLLKARAITFKDFKIELNFMKIKENLIILLDDITDLEIRILNSPKDTVPDVIKEWFSVNFDFYRNSEIVPTVFAKWIIEFGMGLNIPRNIRYFNNKLIAKNEKGTNLYE